MLTIPMSGERRRARRRTALRLLVAAGTAAVGVSGSIAAAVGAASAAPAPAPACPSVAAGQASGWCGLYPGNATSNVRELGDVTLGASGSTLTVQTQGSATGAAPSTSFACLLATDPGRSRMQHARCARAGGVWIAFSGGSTTIDLARYPQLAGTTFTVQVAANPDARSANGDAFYNNVTVDDASSAIQFS